MHSFCCSFLKKSSQSFCVFAVFLSSVLIFPICAKETKLSSKPSRSSQLYNITASDEYKFVWFRVAKVGTRSILRIFRDNQVPFSIDGYKLTFNPEKHKDYFKFAFVRNPWDRVVSCYYNKVVTKGHAAFSECFDKDFEYFVKYIGKQNLSTADPHIRLQTRLIPMDEVDFIGRLENFTEDLQYVLSVLGLQCTEIPQANRTDHVHYSTYYNEKTQQIIAKKYRDDIEAFGYQFENSF